MKKYEHEPILNEKKTYFMKKGKIIYTQSDDNIPKFVIKNTF